MRALSLWQVWATLMAIGAKRFETRSWGTDYRGPLAVHAATKSTPALRSLFLTEPFGSVLRAAGYASFPALPLGAVIAVVDLKECWKIGPRTLWRPNPGFGERWIEGSEIPTGQERAFGDFSSGRFAWECANPRPLRTPLPLTGRQGLWKLTPTQERQVLDAL